MKLPRDITGEQLAKLLARYEYKVTRQSGSHMRLTTTIKGTEHHITIPHHNPLRVGTLSNILKDVANYLKIDTNKLIEEILK